MERVVSSKSILITLLLLSSLQGCSLWRPSPKTPEKVEPQVEVKEEPSIPFQLKIQDELNDGTNLYVKASLGGQVEWRPEDIGVKLITVRSGEAKASSVYRVADLLPIQDRGRLIAPGDEVLFTLQGEGGNISDYQLELLWGDDAKELVAEKVELPSEESFLALENLTVGSDPALCESESCITRFQLQGELVNKGDHEVSRAEIAVGFLWVPIDSNQDLTGQIPEKEERIVLKDLRLGPGRHRTIKLNFTKAVPSSDKGEFVPTARIMAEE